MKIAVIWAWASWMMAAATMVEEGVPAWSVTLFEGNSRMGKKVAITWWWRCNVTTGISSKKDILSKYPRWAEFIEGALWAFSPKKTREWFASHGCEIKIQDDLRAFPASDKWSDVVAVFERALSGADLRFGAKVVSIRRNQGDFTVEFSHSSVIRFENFDAVILSTGAAAYANTWSDGGWHALARSLGHSVTELAPSLSAFITFEPWCREFSGLSLPYAKFLDKAGSPISEGAVMFTHFWITGPAVFAMSAKLAFEKVSETSAHCVRMVPDASKNFDAWEHELSTALNEDGAKELKNVLSRFFPRRFSEILPALAGLAPETKAATVSKDSRRNLVKLLSSGISMTLCGQRPGEEFVTAWGVALNEVRSDTFESNIVSGLFITGELLDVDAVTWGFNLQACWSSGRAAWKALAKRFSAPL